MDKKIPNKDQEIKNISLEQRRKRNSSGSAQINDKRLPWWVELLFVQIGLPDKWLIKILNSKKNIAELLKNEKRFIATFLFVLAGLTYFFPVVKYSKSKLECESISKSYILENKRLDKINRKQLRMLSTNFCNGGNEIYEIDNLKD